MSTKNFLINFNKWKIGIDTVEDQTLMLFCLIVF